MLAIVACLMAKEIRLLKKVTKDDASYCSTSMVLGSSSLKV